MTTLFSKFVILTNKKIHGAPLPFLEWPVSVFWSKSQFLVIIGSFLALCGPFFSPCD